MRVEFNYVFDRKKVTLKNTDKAVIELRAYYQAKTKYFSTKIEIQCNEWDSAKEKINSKHPNSDTLNDELHLLMAKLIQARQEAQIKNQSFTLDSVKPLIKSQIKKTGSYSEFVAAEIENNHFFKPPTKIQHRATLKKLTTFNKNKSIMFSDLNYNFFSEFVNYSKGRGLSQNTIRKDNKNCKAMIESAIKKGYFDGKNPCKEIKIREVETTREVLTWAQILELEKLSFEKYENTLEEIRDMFLFSCYTGLRISDVTNLKTEFLKDSEEGLQLNFITQKVGKHAVLPLLKLFPISAESTSRPINIVRKYLKPHSEFIFPRYSDQYINRGLKQIAELANIKIKLTFHIGRTTFATYMANKVPSTTLKRLLQHSDLKTTERYIHLNEKMVQENLIKANWD
jgi:site-specific recombinase XerD